MRFLLTIIIALTMAIPVSAQWQYGGIQISGNNYGTGNLATLSDGNSGVFIAWRYYSEQFNPDIYVQHLDSAGHELWPHEGIPAAIEPYGQYTPQLTVGDSGRTLISWMDYGRDNLGANIYAQKIGTSGERLWGDLGLPIIVRPGDQMNQLMISDGEGGALISWTDTYPPDTECVIIQRIDGFGSLIFGQNGIRVTLPRTGRQALLGLIWSSDSNFIVSWYDNRLDGAGAGLYAQKFSISGELLWNPNGMPVAVNSVNYDVVRYSASPAGGLYCFWNHNAGHGASYQCVDGQGRARFGPGGVVLTTENSTHDPYLLTATDGRALVLWANQIGTDRAYANLFDTTGTMEWIGNQIVGLDISGLYSLTQSIPGEFEFCGSKSDQACNFRAFKYSISQGHVWGDSGVCIDCPGCPQYRGFGVSDMNGGSYYIWQLGDLTEIMANRVYPDGWVVPDTTDAVWEGGPLPEAVRISNYPNPFNSSTLITLTGLIGKDVEIRIYDIEGRLVDKLYTDAGRIIWYARNSDTQVLPSGLYFAKIMRPVILPALKMIYVK